MAKVWKRGEKAATVISVMEANRDKSYDQVVGILVTTLETTEFDARAYYRYMVRHGKVTGIEKTWKMGKPAKVGKASAKTRTVKRMAKEVLASVAKSADEIAAIKAKNLETLKAVSRSQKKVRDFTQPEVKEEADEGDYDPRMNSEDINALLLEEKLIGQVPRYAHLEG